MNERIKELLDQACQHAHDTHYAHVKSFKHVKGEQIQAAQNTMQEKFAELIIKECANFVDDNLSLSETGYGQADGWINGNQLKEHFGVKE